MADFVDKVLLFSFMYQDRRVPAGDLVVFQRCLSAHRCLDFYIMLYPQAIFFKNDGEQLRLCFHSALRYSHLEF